MANGVWHSGLQQVLELDKEDLGLGSMWPSLPALIESLLQPVAERDRELLVCVERSQGRQCKAELSGVKSPHMYVRKHRGPDGALRLRAAHLPTAHEMTAEESDRHKAMKDFLARTGQSAGLEVRVEEATRNRRSRPDVTIIGDGGASLGCEAQYYNASAATVLRRSKTHAEAGLIANWITHDDRFHLIDRSNWILTRQMGWREISKAQDLALMGGFRTLVEWRCTASAERPCPNGLLKTGCSKMHLEWDTPRGLDDEGTGWTGHQGNTRRITVGQTLIGAATGSVAPLFASSRKDQRSGAYMWVAADDRIRWEDYRSEEASAPDDQQASEEAVHFSGKDADTTCNFGAATWTPSAPLERRGIYGVELTLTVDDPAPARKTMLTPTLTPQARPGLPPLDAHRAAPGTASTSHPSGPLADKTSAPLLRAQVPAQPVEPAIESVAPDGSRSPISREEPDGRGLPASLIALQRAADLERKKLDSLDCHHERARQRQVWFETAATAQGAITQYARTEQLNRSHIEQAVRRAVQRDGGGDGEQ